MSDTSLTFLRPDDWHVHLRDGEMLAAVVQDTALDFARAIVMPNLVPPVTTAGMAAAYRERIRSCLPANAEFEPLMTCYLTDRTDAHDLEAGFTDGVFTAAKLYPAGATTNSASGVTDIGRLDGVFEVMSAIGMPLLVHGEVVDPDIDIFDREAVFIDRVLGPLRGRHPELRVVFEHITTTEAAEYVAAGDAARLGATITPHHLVINRNAMFVGGIRPHMYCLPVAKRERHREALVRAACSGSPQFFLGTDSAPHPLGAKESACGCAGIYNSPSALASYLEVFFQAGALSAFEGFASRNGPAFYGLPVNGTHVRYERVTSDDAAMPDRTAGADRVRVFDPGFESNWVRT